ncbi:Major capsid protein Gp5 [uncultured Caudovirales phage]|uniref:Major capsid protein Gp5 n=1 Tax=uncultured Caudovirales phage TaxID=2100421 RepID=A0A6J5PP20_9CAUD|nr:Major capsid protein Gp5 [uncultured Caudovirales phage]CAB4200632.1 Major capsid protein Gp5 [uncultured Caudovirales phage]CAB5238331.1 Major capsid protein Gp5 [uncultured Caudovirales phage]
MPNTLTNLIPSAYRALNVVSRELVGFIPSVQLDPSAEMLAVGQTIYIPQAPVNSAGKDITPAMAFPTAAYQTIGSKSHSLTKQRAFPFSWQNEERKAMDSGPGYLSINEQQIAQALRAAVNEIEVDIAVAAAAGASRAFGATAGTAPILTDWAQAKKILDDNGAPSTDRTSVFDTTAGVALRSTSNLYKVNEAGDGGSLLRQGVLGNLFGFNLRESAQIQTTTKGTAASATTNAAGYAVGATVLTLASAGTGTIVAGDIVTFAGDSNKYVVASGDADVSNGGTITLAEPGLRVAMSAATKAITVFGTSARNTAFSRNSILLSTRLPASVQGDLATDRQVITDPLSGISFELSMYPGDRMVHYEVGVCWGVTVIKPEHLAIIVG